MGLTEKQYKHILSKLSEQSEAEPVKAEPEAGTSSTQAGGTGYPEVGKWESGLNRGPANQIGVTKWADVVGSKLTRSKANQLKEQYWPNPKDTHGGNTGINISTGEKAHTESSIASLILGMIPHPVTMGLSAMIMVQDAKRYEKEGDQKTANLMYIFAAMGTVGAVLKIPGAKELGAQGMSMIGEKLSKGLKLLPTENYIVNKIIENKDLVANQLKKLAQTKPAQKVGKVVQGTKKVMNTTPGKWGTTLGAYGTLMGAHDSYYYDLYPEDLKKYEQSRLDAIAERKKKYSKDGGNNQIGGTTQNKK